MKYLTLLAMGMALTLTACSSDNGSADYSYETQAPYADSRTAGVVSADRVFQKEMRK